MKNTHRSFIMNVLLSLVALLVIGGSMYLFVNKKVEAPIQDKIVPATITEKTSYQYLFELKNTPDYSINFSVKNCQETTCDGPAIITIEDNKSKVLLQTIHSEDLYFFKDTLAKTSTNDTILYDEQSPIIIGDYNFDGQSDLAIRNGNNSGYGGPSYDIYLFDPANINFTLSQSLTSLSSENLGMFFVDKAHKQLTTYSKSGCCWHQTDKYEVIHNQPKLIYTLIEDASGYAKVKEGNMLITEKKLVYGKWVATTKEVNEKEYYGN